MHQQYKMENDEFEQACIKNRTCYSFDDIIKWEDCYLDNLITDQKSSKNLLIYDISHKTLNGPKHLRIRFDKTDVFIKIYDGSKYWALFSAEKYDAIYGRIRHLISQKNRYICSHYFAKIKVKFYDSIPLEKRFPWDNIIILIKPVFNRD